MKIPTSNPTVSLDPSPRKYPDFVTLKRRSARGLTCAGETGSLEDVEAWLLSDAMTQNSMLEFFEETVWRWVAAGVLVDRSSLHAGTLHPLLFGFTCNWNRADGLCDEIYVSEAVVASAAYQRNPISRTIGNGERFDYDLEHGNREDWPPLMRELADQGYTAYHALPLTTPGRQHNALTVATHHPGGFPSEMMARMERLFRVMALHIEGHIARRIADNLGDTYMGRLAGRQVLDGAIKRGSGGTLRAILWASDMRHYTELSGSLGGDAMLHLLNSYFDRLVGCVLSHGGDVLKFMGDGLLAVFPLDSFASDTEAAKSALCAAEEALSLVADLGQEEGLEQPIETGIALHKGQVFFGNVGAPNRLDFTTIGPAVNTVARVEELTKTLKHPLLITEPVAALIERPLVDLGVHLPRGVPSPLQIFTV